jgi:RimJ/RimL family protein N-acetyltransferase
VLVELAPTHYHRVAPVFRDAVERSGVEAVFSGKRRDRVFVIADAGERPVSAMVGYLGNFYLGGQVSDEIIRLMLDAPAEVSAFSLPAFGFYPMTQNWERALLAAKPPYTRVIPRRMFRLEAEEATAYANWRDLLPGGATVHRLDQELAERVDRELSEQYIGPLWLDDDTETERYPGRGYENFIRSSFGYAMMINGGIACAFWAFCISHSAASVEVETARVYRGRGFASLTGGAWLEHCRAAGLASEWVADEDNIASIRLALKLGHKEVGAIKRVVWRDWGQDLARTEGVWRRSDHPLGTGWQRRL